MRVNLGEFERPEGDNVIDWLRPTGSTFMDGLRLAIINTVFLVALLVFATIGSLLLRLATWVLPFPVFIPAIVLIIGCLAFGALFWQRFAAAHGREAMARGRQTRPDVFGALGALPFIAMALLLLSSGLLSLFLAVITFSGDRIIDALVRMLYGVIFGAASAAHLVIARAASDY